MYKKLREKHVDLAMMLSTCVEFIVMNVSSESSEELKVEIKEDTKKKVKKKSHNNTRTSARKTSTCYRRYGKCIGSGTSTWTCCHV